MFEVIVEELIFCKEKNKYFNDYIVRWINLYGYIIIYEYKESGVGVFV